MKLLMSRLLLALLMVTHYRLARTSWTSERQNRIDEYHRRNEDDHKEDLGHLMGTDLDPDLDDTERGLVARGLQAALIRARRLIRVVPSPYKSCNDPNTEKYSNDSLSSYNQTLLQATYFSLFKKFAASLMSSDSFRTYMTPQMFEMIEHLNLELLASHFLYLTINQGVVLVLHLLITMALILTLHKRNQERPHVITALTPEQIQALEANFSQKYERELKEQRNILLDVLHLMETHKRLLESNYRLQQAACDHSLHILDAQPQPAGGWLDTMRSSMRKTKNQPPRPPPPIGPNTLFYGGDGPPMGESPNSPATLLISPSDTATVGTQKVTITGAADSSDRRGTASQIDADEMASTHSSSMALLLPDDAEAEAEAEARLANIKMLNAMDESSSWMTTDSRFASIKRRHMTTFSRVPEKEEIPLVDLPGAQAAGPPATIPPPPPRMDLAEEIRRRRAQMKLPSNDD